MGGPVLLAVAHGTRDGRDRRTIEALLERVRLCRPGLPIRSAYLHFAAPSVPAALAQTDGRAVVVPLMLASGYHIRVDLPTALYAAIAAAGRSAAFALAPALGPDPQLVDALLARLRAAGWRPGTAIVLAANGSTDPRAAADVRTMGRALAARAGVEVRVGFAATVAPSVQQVVRSLRETGASRVAVATYLIAPGEFRAAAATAGADLISAPLGDHDALVRLVLARYDTAVAALGTTSGIKLCAP